MKNTVNYLRTYRKQTQITQSDIAFLLEKEDNSNLSRCEKGKRSPSLEMIMVYHLLFNTPVISFFTNQRDAVKQNLIRRIAELIEDLERQEPTENIQLRKEYLSQSLKRLTQEKTYENKQ
jgi:transcriptional regulator with XRE-family HTH domain